ncbi:MAG: hypothetical protein N4A50_06260 [Vallitalea sp.]|jgi:hypothetical protein|nr:hypothetical protein [Vallitalea sp.]
MSEVINFSDLKRNKLRKIVKRPDSASPIEIYNPNPEQQEDIVKLLTNNYNSETKEVSLTEKEVLEVLIPMLTNIVIDTKDKEAMNEIIEDPSDILLEIQGELIDIVKSIIKRFMKIIESLSELPEEDVNKLLNINTEKESNK